MSVPTFKEFLIEASKKGKKDEKGDAAGGTNKKLFNHAALTTSIKKVIKLMDKTYDDSLTLLEMIVLTKEVLISRLDPYREDPEYKERKGKDDEATSKAIFDEIEDTLSTHFPKHRGQILRQFLTLIVQPIMDEIQRVGIANAASYFDHKRFDSTAKDSFGKFIDQLENSVIVPNAEDKEVAQKVLALWAKDARHKAKEAKLTSKQRRLRRIAAAVEKVQDNEDTNKEDE
jgi:hypothetical protein